VQIEVKKQFIKDLDGTPKSVRQSVEQIIFNIKAAELITSVENVKKLKGHQDYYRIRAGDYRIGFAIVDSTVILSRFLHRKEIYRFFP
jgi:mRNA interferase RelE/StbE